METQELSTLPKYRLKKIDKEHHKYIIAKGTTKYQKYIPYLLVYVDPVQDADGIALIYIYKRCDGQTADDSERVIINSWEDIENYNKKLGVQFYDNVQIKELV